MAPSNLERCFMSAFIWFKHTVQEKAIACYVVAVGYGSE